VNPWLKHVLQGLGGGVAVTLGLAAIKAVENRPEFLPQLLSGGFLSFCALVCGMFFFDRRMQQFSELQARHVAAQEALAVNVGMLVAKDDVRAETMEAAMRYVAKAQTEAQATLHHVVSELAEIKSRLS
jgi:hypothetical protein